MPKGKTEIANRLSVTVSFQLSADGKDWTNEELEPSSNQAFKDVKQIRFNDNPHDSSSVRSYTLGNSDRYEFTYNDDHFGLQVLKPRK